MKRIRLTNDIIDDRLNGRNIKRLDDYITAHLKIKFQCLIDKYIWEATPNNILNGKRGCPKCSRVVKLTNKIVDERLENKTIKRLDNVNTCEIKIKWQCKVCLYIWSCKPSNILNNNTGCPSCCGNIKLTDEKVDLKIANRNIIRIGKMINNHSKIEWKCIICHHIWKTTPDSITNGESGCPVCSTHKNEKLILSLLKDNDIKFNFQYVINNIIVSEHRRIYVDFYIPKINTIIEYNGCQHYAPTRFGGISFERANNNFTKQQERDIYLQNFCNINNINLIWIDGRIYQNSNLKDYIINNIIIKLRNIVLA